MVARTLNRLYIASKEETSPFYDNQFAQSIERILDHLTPSPNSVEELEELIISKSSDHKETRNLLFQLREACEDAWNKITAFDRLITSHAQGVTLQVAKDKRSCLELTKEKLERKIKENDDLIQKVQENIDLQTATIFKLTNQHASDSARTLKDRKFATDRL